MFPPGGVLTVWQVAAEAEEKARKELSARQADEAEAAAKMKEEIREQARGFRGAGR